MNSNGSPAEFTVTSLDELAAIYKKPADAVLRKVTDHVTAPGRAFIAASPFVVLSTRRSKESTARPREMRPASSNCSTTARC